MTVKELIEILQTKPQDIQVIYSIYSEFALLEAEHIKVRKACPPRADGWIQYARPDLPEQEYLAFPGN